MHIGIFVWDKNHFFFRINKLYIREYPYFFLNAGVDTSDFNTME